MHPTYVAFGSRGDKVGLKGMRLLLARPAACAAVRWQPGGNSVRCFQLAGQPVVMAGADCWFLLIQVVATYHGDHAYCFDITGAAQPSPPSHPGSSSSCASRQQQQPLDLFAHPLAAAALAAGGGGGHVKNERPAWHDACGSRAGKGRWQPALVQQAGKWGGVVWPACKATPAARLPNCVGLPSNVHTMYRLPWLPTCIVLPACTTSPACSTTKP